MKGLAEVLAEHEGTTFDLGTPRQYTRHGGWNESCTCGEPLGDGGHPTPLGERHRAHLATVIDDLIRERLAGAREDVVDEVPCLHWCESNYTRGCTCRADRTRIADAALAAVAEALGVGEVRG